MASNGDTVLLAADSTEAETITLPAVGTYIIDPYGFAYANKTVVVAEGLELESAIETDSAYAASQQKAVVYTVKVKKTHTETTAVPMPLEEIASTYSQYLEASGGDYEKAAVAIGKNGRPVWESWLIGLDSENAEDKEFTAKVEMVDGKPVITWTPDLNEGGTKSVRKYTILGSSNLKNWVEVSAGQEKDYNFFKVSVTVE